MAPSPQTTAGQIVKERRSARLPRPLREFLETEIAGGIFLLAAVVVALVWANSPWAGAYERLWHTELRFAIGARALGLDLRHWVNDGLMVVFFFVVGLEVKRELVVGELNSVRKALLPAAAAIGGMVVPAAIYVALNAGGEAAGGWAIPMATDIALALGALALIGRNLPPEVRVLLLSLAIVDDIGAILVIAVFYSEGISLLALVTASGLVGVILLLRTLRVWWTPVYVFVGVALWLVVLLSGIHATIAGVALGLLAPARPLRRGAAPLPVDPDRGLEGGEEGLEASEARLAAAKLARSVPVTERLAEALHPWTSYLILPVFALANAGISLDADALVATLYRPVTIGIVAGLVVGKVLGITGAAWLSTRLGARLPEMLRWRQVVGVSALGGIGFTMSLFISALAFEGELLGGAKVGILVGSVLAAIVAAFVLRGSGNQEGSTA